MVNSMVENKQKTYLRMLYKRYKVGLITEDDLTEKEKKLLRKYYGL